MSRHLGHDVGERREERSSGSITHVASCSPLKGRRILVTDTDSAVDYHVSYLTYSIPHMTNPKAGPIKATFAFFKVGDHRLEVGRQKLIAKNLGLTVHTRTEKIIHANKYGKKEITDAARREMEAHNRRIEEAKKARQAKKTGDTNGNNATNIQSSGEQREETAASQDGNISRS